MASKFRQVRVLLFVSVILVFIATILRTITLSTRTDRVRACESYDADFITANPQIIENFRTALRFETVTEDTQKYNKTELLKFGDFIKTAFPIIFSSPLVKAEVISNYSLLFTLQGSNTTLRPYLLMSHLDVVPADARGWDVPPFSAEIKDGFIYGRGTIDDKHGVMGILESLNYLLSTGFHPHRTLIVAFGHDEEGSGVDGARVIAATLRSRGIKNIEYILDEGLTVADGVIKGLDKPAALIGTSEKGTLILELTAEGTPGHASMPHGESIIGILAKAVIRLEENPHPIIFGAGPERALFENLAPEMSLPFRYLMSNIWLFKPLITWFLSRRPESNAMQRTMTAVTMFNAGVKSNVLASSGKVIVNHRIHPSQTVKEVIDYDRKIIADDRVKLTIRYEMEALPLSPHGDEDFGYQTVKNSIRQIFTRAVVAPGLMIANTDTRHYTDLSKNIYRFSPSYMYPNDLARFHGFNERISIKNYQQAINFYYHLIQNSDKAELPPYHKHGEEL